MLTRRQASCLTVALELVRVQTAAGPSGAMLWYSVESRCWPRDGALNRDYIPAVRWPSPFVPLLLPGRNSAVVRFRTSCDDGPPPSAGRASRRGAGSERAVADGHRPRCSPLTGAGGGTTRHHAGKALRPERSPQRTGDAFLHTKSRPDSGTDNKRNAVEPQGSTLPARCFQRSSTLTIVMEANRRRPVFVAGHRER